MVEKMKYMVMFQYSICDMHFGIMKSELIFGIFVRILLAINYLPQFSWASDPVICL